MLSSLSTLSEWWAWPNGGINWEVAKSYQKLPQTWRGRGCLSQILPLINLMKYHYIHRKTRSLIWCILFNRYCHIYRVTLPHSRITTYTDTNYLCLLSVCLVAGNLIGNTGRNGHTIIALYILIYILSTTMAGTVGLLKHRSEVNSVWLKR